MKEYRVSWKALSMLLFFPILSLVCVIAFSISRDWMYTLTTFATLIGTSFWFYHYYKLRRNGAVLIIDDEGVTINFKGQKIFWSEIGSITHYKDSFLNQRRSNTTMIYPKTSAYKDIRIRFNKPYAMPGYGVDWPLIENARDFKDTVFARWEAHKQSENQPKT